MMLLRHTLNTDVAFSNDVIKLVTTLNYTKIIGRYQYVNNTHQCYQCSSDGVSELATHTSVEYLLLMISITQLLI